MGLLSAQKAHAASTIGYKALVCLFFQGGLDHADVLIPYDQNSYDTFAGYRPGIINAHGTRRRRDALLEIDTGFADGRQFAVPPELAGIKTLYDNGEAAILAGVGPLIEPVTREDMEAARVALPPRLHSHNDQQSTWQTFRTEGARFGWGGRFADAMLRADPGADPLYAAMTTGLLDVFLSGEVARQFRVAPGGPDTVKFLGRTGSFGTTQGDDEARDVLRTYLQRTKTSSDNLYMRDIVSAQGRAIPNTERFKSALSNGLGLSTVFPNTGLGRQLYAIAETISIQSVLGNSRQVFYARMGGFDTHASQAANLPALQIEISDAVLAFRQAMFELGRWSDTTLFTMSDFGRTVVENGSGTDHGWGGHHVIAGGSVRGGQVYGRLPDSDVASSSYTPFRGRMIPTVSVDQYAATLGQWFGLDDSELDAILPNIDNFDTRTIGFL
ncbi:MAG: DUF1501 domain-containing protein [Pseudomonadota bacterium]